MKIGILIPDKNDRPKFLQHSLFLLSQQTIQPDFVEVVNFESGLVYDLNLRYRVGIESLKNKGADVIFFWENDDYYSPIYLEVMLSYWNAYNQPKLFGIGNTNYYHLSSLEHVKLTHKDRSSAFSTMISKNIFIDYPNDNDKDFDLKLWSNCIGETFEPLKPICLGIKHNQGLCGGKGHNVGFKYNQKDKEMLYLESIVDKESFKFYKEWHIKLK
jgi:hypothetical protein